MVSSAGSGVPGSSGVTSAARSVGGCVTWIDGATLGAAGIEKPTASRKFPYESLPAPLLTARKPNRVQVWPAGTV